MSDLNLRLEAAFLIGKLMGRAKINRDEEMIADVKDLEAALAKLLDPVREPAR